MQQRENKRVDFRNADGERSSATIFPLLGPFSMREEFSRYLPAFHLDETDSF